MCGIIGYSGGQNAVPHLLHGVRRLEYREYDSAGLAVLHDKRIEVRRSVGKLVNLEKALNGTNLQGAIGIGHTRWATTASHREADSPRIIEAGGLGCQ
jgi:glutamine---fructose-6-phosphate transaminase (isomerizing)